MEKIGRGGTIRRWGYYQDGSGQMVDPSDPKVSITDSNGVVVTSNQVPVRSSLGSYYFDYVVPVDAPFGVYVDTWSGLINGIFCEASDNFQVVEAGTIVFVTDRLRARLRIKIQDTEAKAFGDEELNDILKDALNAHNSDLTFNSLPESEEFLVIKLAWADCCEILATNSAKYYALNVNDINVDKSSRVKGYLDLAKTLREEYEKDSERMGLDTEVMPEIEIGTLVRREEETELEVPREAARSPDAVSLLPIELGLTGELDLEWTRNLEEDFCYYEIYCNGESVVQISDSYQLVYTDKELTSGVTYTYQIAVVDLNGLISFSNSESAVAP